MSAKKKVFAVSALTLGGIAGATGTAYAAQGGVTTEAPSGTTTAVAEQPQAKKPEAQKAKPSSTKKQSSATAQATAPAPTITQAEKAPPRDSSGGQGGISTELPTERKAESTAKQAPKVDAPTRVQAETAKPAPTQAAAPAAQAAPATATQTAPAATVQQASHVTPAQTATAANTSAKDVAAPATQGEVADYADIAAAPEDADETKGQAGVVTELPADDATGVTATVAAPTGDVSIDYNERVEAASQASGSEVFAPAAPVEPTDQVSAYSAPRANGGEVGIAGGGVATGTAVEVNDTTSYVSNTTTGGGEQATAAQTWDASNGNYNAGWATTGGVSGTGGVSATNEQTAPNVGTAGVDGQWSSPDGASTVSVTGGATLQNYGVHDASGSIEVNTPIGNMAFTF